ncbi:hypothetical protein CAUPRSCDRAFT_12007 [Caulochytrium protostelioides]|uniref:Uncharacterized protein n=1 Tax=Caulochytrium protostelioides TaxID=1555241 RepID=A0A4P9WXU7_9FUNG|nr:hypothetical protein CAUPRSCDRAFT_12007 [Caulochytrium protostelioides]
MRAGDVHGLDHTRVVQIALGDQADGPLQRRRPRVRQPRNGLQDMLAGLIDERVHRVEAQAVDVEVAEPHRNVVQDVAPDRVRLVAVQVQRGTPGRLVLVVEVGRIRAQIRAGGPEMVVDDIEDDGEAVSVGGVDEAAQPARAPVGLVDGIPRDAVVAPPVGAVERVHGQQLDMRDAQVAQVRELRDRRIERALGREGAHVHLVDDAAIQRAAGPRRVMPRVRGRVVDAAQRMHAVRQPRGAGVRQGLAGDQRVLGVVQQKAVVGARLGGGVGDVGAPRAGRGALRRGHRVGVATELELGALGLGGPDIKDRHDGRKREQEDGAKNEVVRRSLD